MPRERNTIFGALLISASLANAAPSLAQPMKQSADLVLLGGQVYTIDACRSSAQAVAVSKGKIVFVGSDQDAQSYVGAGTKVQELAGRMVLPSFHDSHCHLMQGGMQLSQCMLQDAQTKDQALAAVKKFGHEHKQSDWLIGAGWALPLFPDANPRKEDLDVIEPDRPVFLLSQDEHSAWVNSKALALAGISRGTGDPPRGRIERDKRSGEPTGTLRESAVDQVLAVAPKPTDTQRADGLERAVNLANSFGITSVQDADCNADVLNAYLEVQRRGQLNLKVVAALHVDPALGVEQVPRLIDMRSQFSQGRLRATATKMFADGVIEAHTAGMLQHYTDHPSDQGILNFPAGEFDQLVALLTLAKFQIHVHAIGDAAINEALNAFEKCGESKTLDLRDEIAHLEVIAPQDIPRFSQLGVIANCQPFWAYSDSYIKTCTLPLIGDERAKQLYLFGSLYRCGATLAGGSDWPVSTMNPLDEIQVAVTRQSLDDKTEPPLLPDQRLALPDALAMYTINGAFVNHEERETGSLEVGKAADLIVLNKDLFSIDPHEIHTVKVLLTLLDGQTVFRDENFPEQDVAQSKKTDLR